MSLFYCRPISSNRSRGLTANTIELYNGVGHRNLVRCVIRDVLQYVLVLNYGIQCSKKRKSHTLKLKLEAGEPGGFNRSRVSNTSRVSNKAGGSDGIVLIQAGPACISSNRRKYRISSNRSPRLSRGLLLEERRYVCVVVCVVV